ncbi:MASE3 domain-containing sensor histidine kinase [Clostridium thermarum]|uniref:MASE3 domain-containing sensor histidine kinase n=1 Tax=Clostridium thermarum TaxID=1716543 RepID=UPI0013D2F660|nr:ATP-binding protein [Clostridium thermarum]
MLQNNTSSNNPEHIFNLSERIVIFSIVIIALLFLASYDIDFFHIIVENIGVVLGCCIMIISLFTYKLSQDKNFHFIGLTYGFASIFEFTQALYPAHTSISLQFSVLARFFHCFFLLFINNRRRHKLSIKRLFYIYSVITIILFISVYLVDMLPEFEITDGVFSTSYIVLCYISIAVFSVSITFLIKNRLNDHAEIRKYILTYFILMILYQVSIIIAIPDTELHLAVIHFIKLFCSYPIFMMIIKLALKDPIKLFFADLSIKNDELAKKEQLLKRQNQELVTKNKALISANSEILKSHHRYKQLLHFLPHAVVLLKGTQIVFTNKVCDEMFKDVCDGSLLNRNIIDLIPEDCKNKFRGQLDEVYYGKNIQCAQAKLILNKNKSYDLEYTLLYNVLDDEQYALLILEDVTEKKQAQEILTKAKIDEENEQLKIGFLANISHELRTPINLIYSAIQLEDKYIHSGKVSDTHRFNKVIKQNCFRLLRIINNLIDATKIDACFFKPNKRYMNIITVIEECTLSVVPFAESKSISLIFDTDVEEKYMLIDPDLIERIILNLLANSVKYGVYEGKIYVNIEDLVDSINIRLKDNGIGIPKDKISLLFNRFARIDKSFSRNTEGSGIGLYLVKQFVEMHGGSISVESEEGNGVEFCINLPCNKNQELPFEEIKMVATDLAENSNIIDKVNIEFSDIYME